MLTGQPDELREMLLRTAVLDRVCGGLADALTGRADGERLLGDLRQATGFLVPLGGEPAWYRCHRLFGELLNAELSRRHPDVVPDLHRRAAAWFAMHGSMPEALRHLMAAGDWRRAAGLLSRHWPAITLCGHGEAQRTPLPPLPPQAVAADPALALAYATDRLDVSDLDGADAYLRLAERHQQVLGEDRSTPFPAMVAGCRLAWAQLDGDLGEVMSSAHQLLALSRSTPDNADNPDNPDRNERDCRTIALTALATARLSLGDVSGAQDALTDALREAQQAGSCPRRACTSTLALLHAERGDLRSAESAACSALAMAPCAGRRCAGHAAPAHMALAIVHYHRDRLTESDRCLDQAANVLDRAGSPALTAAISILRSMILRDRGDLGHGCELLLAGRRALNDRQRSRHLEHCFAAAEAELRLAHGDAAGARELLVHTLADGTEGSGRLAVSLARACLQDGDPGAAARGLPLWSDDRTTTPFLALQLDAGLVAARAARDLGDHHGATRTLERVLELAEPDDYRRIFTRGGTPVRDLLAAHLDAGTAHWLMVRRLLDATTEACADDPPRPPGIGEPLTERELTVLRYLQGMLSNGEIASELYLSVNTVKTHVRNIYQKLGTPRRREAVRRARELRLL